MKIWMIWTADDEECRELYLVEAWDDETTMANPEGWQEAVKKAKEVHGEIRIVSKYVDLDKIRASFMPVEV